VAERAEQRRQSETWYDEIRENLEQQFKVSLCFKDVYQFRQALSRLHIVQVRNYHFHMNTLDRIIVWCKQKESNKWDCPFYMTASKIKKNEPTFCIKKMHLKHSCPTEPASTRVNAKWLSSAYVDEYKSDITTCITSLQDKALKDFGVDVGKRMTY
jgi:hypothetical protein